MAIKKTKKAYVEYLNDCQPEQGSEDWIIGGTIRMAFMWQKKYGEALRKHDPVAFQTGYNEWLIS